MGSRAEAVLHKGRMEEEAETMNPPLFLLPSLPANGTLKAGTSVHSAVMKGSGVGDPPGSRNNSLQRGLYDKEVFSRNLQLTPT